MLIDSIKNPLVQTVKSLLTASGRQSEGCCLIEGDILVNQIIGSDVKTKFVLQPSETDIEQVDGVHGIKPSILAQALGTKNKPSQMVSVCEIPRPKLLTNSNLNFKVSVVFDHIVDPGNQGTLLRSLAGLGVDSVIVVGEEIDFYALFSRAVINAGRVGGFKLNYFYHPDASILIDLIKENNAISLATSSYDSISITRFLELKDAKKSKVLILGNETEGCSEIFLKKADYRIGLDMKNGIESHNVAIAGSILANYLVNNS